jgi:hypothetical protein
MPALNELIRQAASGGLFYNDDTGMRGLKMERPPGGRAHGEGRRAALFFTGREHAGESLGSVLAERAAELPVLAPVRGVAGAFPGECWFVLETLGRVYANDTEARRDGLSADERLQVHQEPSGPLMESLREWFDEQIRARTSARVP